MTVLVHDALSVFESALAATGRAAAKAGAVPGEAPSETVPSDTAPSETVPSDTAPSETVPSDTAPSETVPSDTAPSETVPSDTGPSGEVWAEVTVLDPGEEEPESAEPAGGPPHEPDDRG